VGLQGGRGQAGSNGAPSPSQAAAPAHWNQADPKRHSREQMLPWHLWSVRGQELRYTEHINKVCDARDGTQGLNPSTKKIKNQEEQEVHLWTAPPHWALHSSLPRSTLLPLESQIPVQSFPLQSHHGSTPRDKTPATSHEAQAPTSHCFLHLLSCPHSSHTASSCSSPVPTAGPSNLLRPPPATLSLACFTWQTPISPKPPEWSLPR
jgi:hypothetical protein